VDTLPTSESKLISVISGILHGVKLDHDRYLRGIREGSSTGVRSDKSQRRDKILINVAIFYLNRC